MLTTIFILGFIADPIINLYLDPYDTITSIPSGGFSEFHLEDEEATWAEHFLKGMASLGLLGFVKAFFAMSPWHVCSSYFLPVSKILRRCDTSTLLIIWSIANPCIAVVESTPIGGAGRWWPWKKSWHRKRPPRKHIMVFGHNRDCHLPICCLEIRSQVSTLHDISRFYVS
jgi:hypothetical protein